MSASIPVPAMTPVSVARARFLPVVGDSMAPTLDHTHMVAVVPVDGYRAEGLYALDVLGDGHVQIMRCEAMGPHTVSLRYDNRTYGHNGEAGWVCMEWFEAAVLGQVAAVLRIVDRTLLEDEALPLA